MRRRHLLGLALAASLPARPALPAQKPDTLHVSWQDRLETLDPYRTPLRTGLMLAHEVFDCLLDRDPETFQLRPLLAESWREVDALTLEFRLRAGTWFHDGSAFGAADVEATVRTVLADPEVAIASNYAWLAGVVVIDELTVRLRLSHPFPAAIEYVAMVLPILPRDIADPERRAVLATSPVGTGPYRCSPIGLDGTVTLSAFDTPIASSPKGRPAIPRVMIRQHSDQAASFDDLEQARADWVWQLTPAQVRRLAADDFAQVVRCDTMRVAYLSFDAAGRSGTTFANPALRRAASMAIDREALAGTAVPGGARVAYAPCAPTQFACDGTAAVRWDHDPAEARRLLDASGISGGVDTELVTYVRPEIARAVAADLAQIGIVARVTVLEAAAALARVAAGTAPLFLGTWGSSSINDISAFLPPFFDFGPLDMARDTTVAALVADAAASIDPERRRGLYRQAIAQITGEALWLPLFVDAASYGVSRELSFRPMPDELPRFYRTSWR